MRPGVHVVFDVVEQVAAADVEPDGEEGIKHGARKHRAEDLDQQVVCARAAGVR